MVTVDGVLAIIAIILMLWFIYVERKKIIVQKLLFPLFYFIMYRTTWGLQSMDAGARRFRALLTPLAHVGTIIGFLGMGAVTFELFRVTLNLIQHPASMPGIMPVLPIQAKGVFFVPFSYWIISIFVIAALHEFAHGLIARCHNIKVQSSGIAILGVLLPIVPAAFVEPDEQQIPKKPAKAQLAMFAAGPFANILLTFFIIFLFGIPLPPFISANVVSTVSPFNLASTMSSLYQVNGLNITELTPGAPATRQGLHAGDVITAINHVPITDEEQFTKTFTTLAPNQHVNLTTQRGIIPVTLGTHPADKSKGYLGVTFDIITSVTPHALTTYGKGGITLLEFFFQLLIWIMLLSLGIGLFNLLPLGPTDGGRMLTLAMNRIAGSTGVMLANTFSWLLLIMILFNIFAGFFF